MTNTIQTVYAENLTSIRLLVIELLWLLPNNVTHRLCSLAHRHTVINAHVNRETAEWGVVRFRSERSSVLLLTTLSTAALCRVWHCDTWCL